MKKVMLVIVCLLFAATAFAQQSDPSNDVGYVKINSTGSGTPGVQAVVAFGLPFKFWNVVSNVPQFGNESTRPSSIIGTQIVAGTFTSADRIVRQDGGATSYRLAPAGTWTGTLESGAAMVPGRAYFYQNKTGLNRFIVLAGDVQNNNDYGIATPLSVTGNPTTAENVSLSWRDSRNVPVSTAVGPQLVAQGFMGGSFTTSDNIVDQAGGSARVDAAGLVWAGSLTQLVPGHAFYILNRVHANNGWTYNYATGLPNAAAASVSAPMPEMAPAITKVPMNVGKSTTEDAKTSSVKSGTVKKGNAAK